MADAPILWLLMDRAGILFSGSTLLLRRADEA